MTEYAATEPEPYRPNLERRAAGAYPDGPDRRQNERNGEGWPRHKARRRNRNRRTRSA